MTTTPRVGATDWAAAQASPWIAHNDALRRIEAGAGRYPVADRVTAPPGSCADGASYIIIATATGAFTGKEGQIATAVGVNAASGWIYTVLGTLHEGSLAYVQDEDADYKWNGSAWEVYAGGGSLSFPYAADVTGEAEPQFELYAESSGGVQANITTTSYGLDGGGIFHGRFARGNRASPTAAQAGDITGGWGSRWCYSAGDFHVSSPVALHAQTTENSTGSAWGGWLRFLTTKKGETTRRERGGITDNGTFWSHCVNGTYDSKSDAQTLPFSDARFVASGIHTTGGSTFSAVGYGTGVTPGFRGGSARGTPASPTASQSGDILCFVGAHGHANSAWTTASKALVSMLATENFTSGAQGTEIAFATTKNGGTTRTDQVKVPNDGGLALKESITAPSAEAGWSKLFIDSADNLLKRMDASGSVTPLGVGASANLKEAVRVATTTAGTLASSFENGDTVDGVALATGDRILVKNQAAPDENGIYVVAASGAPTRATDADSSAELLLAKVYVQEGSTQAGQTWTCGNVSTITLGSTSIWFYQTGADVPPGTTGWTQVGSWTHSVNVANVDFTGLGGLTDLMVIFRNVTKSSSEQFGIQCSVNNGSSFYASSGDYVQVPATGAEAAQPLVSMHTTATTAARSAIATLPGININGVPKPINLDSRDDTGSRLFVASTSPINAIRAIPGGGHNFTGGSIYLFGR